MCFKVETPPGIETPDWIMHSPTSSVLIHQEPVIKGETKPHGVDSGSVGSSAPPLKSGSHGLKQALCLKASPSAQTTAILRMFTRNIGPSE